MLLYTNEKFKAPSGAFYLDTISSYSIPQKRHNVQIPLKNKDLRPKYENTDYCR